MKKTWRNTTGLRLLFWMGTWFIKGVFPSQWRNTRIVRRLAHAPWPDSLWIEAGGRWVCMIYDGPGRWIRISEFTISKN